MATVVAIITSIVVANATQTITTPNAAFVSYSLVAGANSTVITPATNKPVLVMGSCTTPPDEGVGQVSLLHIPSIAIQWVGLESYGSAAITSGASATVGHHIVWIDALHNVAIEVASADTIRIENIGSSTLAGNVTLIW
jgi:hypothetical protein